MAIRYDKNLNAEIRRTVSNFNKKVRRLEATEQEIIPDKTSVKELKEIYKDRRQLKRRLRQLQKFSERGMEKVMITPGGAELTKWEYETERADYIMVKRRLGRQVKLEGPHIPSPYLKKDTTQNAEDKLAEMKKSFKDLSQSELEFIRDIIDKEIKVKYYADTFKNNFLLKFETTLRENGYSEDIITRLKAFSGEELLRMYKSEQTIQDIMEFGDTLGMRIDVKEVKSKTHPEVTISRTQFDNIVAQMVNNLPRYEREYMK